MGYILHTLMEIPPVLTDTKVRNAKPREKAYKLADEKGLYLLVSPNSSKYWRLKYRFLRKEKVLALGTYPDISLANAREKRDDARKVLKNGTDPSIVKQVAKHSYDLATKDSFEAIARKWSKMPQQSSFDSKPHPLKLKLTGSHGKREWQKTIQVVN
jgi:hypothetical protein